MTTDDRIALSLIEMGYDLSDVYTRPSPRKSTPERKHPSRHDRPQESPS